MSEESGSFNPDIRTPAIVISHANQDFEIAESIADALLEESFNTWLASRDIPIGSNWAEEISKAISSADYLIVLLSTNSISSPHVKREVNMAITKGITLLPVLLSGHANVLETLPDDWNYWLSVVQIVTFTNAKATALQIAKQVRRRMASVPPAKATVERLVEPVVSKPTVSKPEVDKPVVGKQVVNKPVVSKPMPTKTLVNKPIEPAKSNLTETSSVNRISKVKSMNSKFKPSLLYSLILLVVLVGIIAFAVNRNSKSDNSAISDQTKITKPSTAVAPSLSTKPSASPKPAVTSKPAVSTLPSTGSSATPTKTASPKPGSSVSITSGVDPVVLKALAVTASRKLVECVSQPVKAPLGCPFREKKWVQASEFAWTLQGSPHLASVSSSGTRFSAIVTFTVVDKASYGTVASHTTPQTISTHASFVKSEGHYVVAWK